MVTLKFILNSFFNLCKQTFLALPITKVKPKYFPYYQIRGTPNEPFTASLERIMVEQYKILFWCDINT